jgi:PPOX class probable FMN-dependent enzyme
MLPQVASARQRRIDGQALIAIFFATAGACYSSNFHGRQNLADLSEGDLKKIYPKPTPRVIAKARPEIDRHARKFIEMSPFCVLATSGTDGSVDASPRGGNPGFVRVTGPNELLMPDRAGNNRIDSFKNIVEGSGLLQLIFFVPGIDETLRVGGTGRLSAEPELLAAMEEFGKLPRAVLHIDVKEAYFHCGKALMRSRLWSKEAQVQRAAFPSISEVIHDQTKLGEAESQAEVEARYKTQL